MRNYSEQYRRYYETLRENNTKEKRGVTYNSNDFLSVYGSNRKAKSKKGFFDSMVNVFIYQLVVALLMVMTLFYLKYSPNEYTSKSYNNIKATLNDTTYSISEGEKFDLDISSVWKKVTDYIKVKVNSGKVNL